MSKLSEEEKKVRKKKAQKKYRDTHKDEINERAGVYHAVNGEKKNTQSRAYYAANKEKERARGRVYCAAHKGDTLKKNYNITLADYERILEKQNGRCKICGKKPGKKMLAVDHCHKTLKARGLLCSNCNVGLGQFKDDLSLLLKAAAYLEEHS